jgi:hypothetical protein
MELLQVLGEAGQRATDPQSRKKDEQIHLMSDPCYKYRSNIIEMSSRTG